MFLTVFLNSHTESTSVLSASGQGSKYLWQMPWWMRKCSCTLCTQRNHAEFEPFADHLAVCFSVCIPWRQNQRMEEESKNGLNRPIILQQGFGSPNTINFAPRSKNAHIKRLKSRLAIVFTCARTATFGIHHGKFELIGTYRAYIYP